jgi:hypothetical protein
VTRRRTRREREEQVAQGAARPRVERAGRLVEREHARVAREHAREARAALLARAQAVGRAVRGVGEADAGERGGDAGGQRVAPFAALARAVRDVLADGGAEELVVGVLEEEADVGADGGRARR